MKVGQDAALFLADTPLGYYYKSFGSSVFACENDAVDGKLFRFEVQTSDIKYFDSDAVSVVSNIAKRPIDFSIEDLRELDRKEFNSEEEIQYLLHEIK